MPMKSVKNRFDYIFRDKLKQFYYCMGIFIEPFVTILTYKNK